MDEYAVIIRAVIKPELTERQLAAVSAETGGTISYDSRTSVLRYTTSMQDPHRDSIAALGKADGNLARAIRRHAGAEHDTREARVLPWGEFEAETFRPSVPGGGLAGSAEAAEILGVSTTRVGELRKTHSSFPKPSEELKATPVWDRAEIERFAREWDRKAGRPRNLPEPPSGQ